MYECTDFYKARDCVKKTAFSAYNIFIYVSEYCKVRDKFTGKQDLYWDQQKILNEAIQPRTEQPFPTTSIFLKD